VLDAVGRLRQGRPATFLLGTPAGLGKRLGRLPIQVVEGETWDLLAHADLALAASGTVTIEAALLGTPMITFYKVTGLSWWLGKFLVNVPYYSMVNLVAERQVVLELMQNEVTGARLAQEAARLLNDPAARQKMKQSLKEVAARLRTPHDPMERAARIVQELVNEGMA